MSTPALSRRHSAALGFITDYIERHGYPPSVREIADGIGLRSVSSAHAVLDVLVRAGALERSPGQPRAIRVVQIGRDESAPPRLAAARLHELAHELADHQLLDDDRRHDLRECTGIVAGSGDPAAVGHALMGLHRAREAVYPALRYEFDILIDVLRAVRDADGTRSHTAAVG